MNNGTIERAMVAFDCNGLASVLDWAPRGKDDDKGLADGKYIPGGVIDFHVVQEMHSAEEIGLDDPPRILFETGTLTARVLVWEGIPTRGRRGIDEGYHFDPRGWRVPNDYEWSNLRGGASVFDVPTIMRFVDGAEPIMAIKKLRSLRPWGLKEAKDVYDNACKPEGINVSAFAFTTEDRAILEAVGMKFGAV